MVPTKGEPVHTGPQSQGTSLCLDSRIIVFLYVRLNSKMRLHTAEGHRRLSFNTSCPTTLPYSVLVQVHRSNKIHVYTWLFRYKSYIYIYIYIHRLRY